MGFRTSISDTFATGARLVGVGLAIYGALMLDGMSPTPAQTTGGVYIVWGMLLAIFIPPLVQGIADKLLFVSR